MSKKLLYSLLALILSTLACRPVLTIGWNEFLIAGILFAVLLGPTLYRFMRRLEDIFRRGKPKK
jgi:hypothetical protein